jgi:hypothetical protein
LDLPFGENADAAMCYTNERERVGRRRIMHAWTFSNAARDLVHWYR